MIQGYLTRRVQIPPRLCWHWHIPQYLEAGEGVLVIGGPGNQIECMTLAGPFSIAADAVARGPWPDVFHFTCPICQESQILRVELATTELTPRECTACNKTHLVRLVDGGLKTFLPGRDC